ncbi:hypothetical protein CF319_g1311 [Tilletia indica]|nr:hypothetical protein CF319_g1311 [Tilletia indica]
MTTINQYNSYCEVEHSLPVLQLRDNPNKSGYVIISTMMRTGDGRTIEAKIHGYWRDDRPVEGSMLHGYFFVAATPNGLILWMDKAEVEVRPGAVQNSNYIRSHINRSSISIRAFGRVSACTPTSFTIEVMTYLPAGLKRGEVLFIVGTSPTEAFSPTILMVGNFAAGRGVVQRMDDTGRLVVHLDEVQLGVEGGPQADSEQLASEYRLALAGEQPPPGGAPVQGAPREISSLTTFLESTHRYIIKKDSGTDSGTCYTELKTADEVTHRVPLRLSATEGIVNGGIYSARMKAGFQQSTMCFGALSTELDIRPQPSPGEGHPDNQLLQLPPRFRAAGRVWQSSTRDVGIEGTVLMLGLELPFRVLSLIPEGRRWKNYRPVPTGSVVGIRGTAEKISYGEECELILKLEHLCNPPPTGSGSPAPVGNATATPSASPSNLGLHAQDGGSGAFLAAMALADASSTASSSTGMSSPFTNSAGSLLSAGTPSTVPSDIEASPSLSSTALPPTTLSTAEPSAGAPMRVTRASAAEKTDAKGKKRAREGEDDDDEQPAKCVR